MIELPRHDITRTEMVRARAEIRRDGRRQWWLIPQALIAVAITAGIVVLRIVFDR